MKSLRQYTDNIFEFKARRHPMVNSLGNNSTKEDIIDFLMGIGFKKTDRNLTIDGSPNPPAGIGTRGVFEVGPYDGVWSHNWIKVYKKCGEQPSTIYFFRDAETLKHINGQTYRLAKITNKGGRGDWCEFRDIKELFDDMVREYRISI